VAIENTLYVLLEISCISLIDKISNKNGKESMQNIIESATIVKVIFTSVLNRPFPFSFPFVFRFFFENIL